MTTDEDFEDAAKLVLGVQLLIIIAWLVVVGLLGWAAVHFIRKFW
jgi:hypothetical protein